MRTLIRRALSTASVVALTTAPAFAADAPHMATWGVAHVTVSLLGTLGTIWLIARGVDKL